MLVHHFHAYGCWIGDISDELMTAVLFGNIGTRGMYAESAVPKLVDCLPRFYLSGDERLPVLMSTVRI